MYRCLYLNQIWFSAQPLYTEPSITQQVTVQKEVQYKAQKALQKTVHIFSFGFVTTNLLLIKKKDDSGESSMPSWRVHDLRRPHAC